MTDKPRKRKLPKPRTITLPAETYQPPKAESEKEHDMPGAPVPATRGEAVGQFRRQVSNGRPAGLYRHRDPASASTARAAPRLDLAPRTARLDRAPLTSEN